MLETLSRLNALYESERLSRFLSRADLYALAGVFAVEEGVRNANVGCGGASGRQCIPEVRMEENTKLVTIA